MSKHISSLARQKSNQSASPRANQSESQCARKPTSQLISQPARQTASQPASYPARPFCTGASIGNQVDGLPIDLSKDAVSASCVLPGRAPIRTISAKNDAVEIFYLKSRLWIMIFQKHCMLKVWLAIPNDQTELLNEKIYLVWNFKDLLKLKKMRNNCKKRRKKENK